MREKTQLLGLWHYVNILSDTGGKSVETFCWQTKDTALFISHNYRSLFGGEGVGKYFKVWVKILNNLENEHQSCPINIAEENEVMGLKIKIWIFEPFEFLEKCQNAGPRS